MKHTHIYLFLRHLLITRAPSPQHTPHRPLPHTRVRGVKEDKDGPVPQTHGFELGREALVEEGESDGVQVGVVEGVEDTPQMPAVWERGE